MKATKRPGRKHGAARRDKQYVLRLYVTGLTPRSRKAVVNVQHVCEEYLQGHYQLEVVDIYQQPSLAKGEQIVAVPTLVKQLPMPLRRLIGDMSNKERILLGLDLQSRAGKSGSPQDETKGKPQKKSLSFPG